MLSLNSLGTFAVYCVDTGQCDETLHEIVVKSMAARGSVVVFPFEALVISFTYTKSPVLKKKSECEWCNAQMVMSILQFGILKKDIRILHIVPKAEIDIFQNRYLT